jgi:hypothetical protein
MEMEEKGITPIFPPLPAPYLLSYLTDLGFVEAGGMEGAPIGWTTLCHWQVQTGITLQPWEARLIRRLSTEYLNQSRKARSPDCPAPWGQVTEEQRASVSAGLRSMFGGLARNKAAV